MCVFDVDVTLGIPYMILPCGSARILSAVVYVNVFVYSINQSSSWARISNLFLHCSLLLFTAKVLFWLRRSLLIPIIHHHKSNMYVNYLTVSTPSLYNMWTSLREALYEWLNHLNAHKMDSGSLWLLIYYFFSTLKFFGTIPSNNVYTYFYIYILYRLFMDVWV